jgi:hypothetical protein
MSENCPGTIFRACRFDTPLPYGLANTELSTDASEEPSTGSVCKCSGEGAVAEAPDVELFRKLGRAGSLEEDWR